MSAEPNFLDVKIMGREYRVACAPEEREALQRRLEELLKEKDAYDLANRRARSSASSRVASASAPMPLIRPQASACSALNGSPSSSSSAARG